jgi:hypothetical protein
VVIINNSHSAVGLHVQSYHHHHHHHHHIPPLSVDAKQDIFEPLCHEFKHHWKNSYLPLPPLVATNAIGSLRKENGGVCSSLSQVFETLIQLAKLSEPTLGTTASQAMPTASLLLRMTRQTFDCSGALLCYLLQQSPDFLNLVKEHILASNVRLRFLFRASTTPPTNRPVDPSLLLLPAALRALHSLRASIPAHKFDQKCQVRLWNGPAPSVQLFINADKDILLWNLPPWLSSATVPNSIDEQGAAVMVPQFIPVEHEHSKHWTENFFEAMWYQSSPISETAIPASKTITWDMALSFS